ncbi:MAG: electron transport complex subunit E [Candidatus Cloacimonetes bacterium]|nr:electron transport complex subunit E [Candidatus Cloacimonadota bacterium]
MKIVSEIIRGVMNENPILILGLGLCPVLAVTTSVENALGMGLATTFVILCSNLLVSLVKSFIPDKIRIPCYIVIIATFTTIINLEMAAFLPDLHRKLGIFIPLITVNCMILGRAESFASKNNMFNSLIDAVGMGIGFTLSLALVASVREILGAGQWYGFNVLPSAFRNEPIIAAVMAPGAFLTLGFILAALNIYKSKYKKEG